MAKETTKHSKIGSTDMSRRISVFKVVLVILLIILQIGVTFAFYTWISAYTIYLKVLALFLTFLAVIYIINKRDNPAYKLIWVVLILAAPLVGGLLYIFFAGNRTRLKFIEEALENHLDTFRYMPSDKENQKEIKELSKSASVQSTYISKAAGYPVYIQEANVRRAVDELGAHAVSALDIYGLDVDVFSPCAMGAIINDETLQVLRAPVIAGAANNQLAKASHADELWRRGCLHAPDYAINAGGIIDVSYEYNGGTPEQVRQHVEGIGETLRQIFLRAKAQDMNTTRIADSLAQERLNA